MKCPKCSHENPQGQEYCLVCYEVLNRSAADHFLSAARRQHEEAVKRQAEDTNTKALGRAFKQLGLQIYWSKPFVQTRDFVRAHYKLLLLGLLIIVLGVGIVTYLSPITRLNLYGTRLAYRFPGSQSFRYLAGYQTDVKSWSERHGQMDTPLPAFHTDEIGSITMESAAQPDGTQVLTIRPQEWIRVIKMDSATDTKIVPLNHPSLVPLQVTLAKDGTIAKIPDHRTVRLGRSIPFLLPRWPVGILHKDAQWTETVHWLDAFGEWRILWTAHLQWRVVGFEPCAAGTCTQLASKAALTAGVWEIPAWAGNNRTVQYSGEGHGNVIFHNKSGRVVANTFSYGGTLSFPIADLNKIPIEERVGRPVASEPGDIVIRFDEKIDVREP